MTPTSRNLIRRKQQFPPKRPLRPSPTNPSWRTSCITRRPRPRPKITSFLFAKQNKGLRPAGAFDVDGAQHNQAWLSFSFANKKSVVYSTTLHTLTAPTIFWRCSGFLSQASLFAPCSRISRISPCCKGSRRPPFRLCLVCSISSLLSQNFRHFTTSQNSLQAQTVFRLVFSVFVRISFPRLKKKC